MPFTMVANGLISVLGYPVHRADYIHNYQGAQLDQGFSQFRGGQFFVCCGHR